MIAGLRARPLSPGCRTHPGRGSGAEATLAKSTVARIRAALQAEFATWQQRALHGLELDYLYLDATAFKMHPTSRRAERCCAPGASPRTAARCWWAWPPGARRATRTGWDFLRRLRAGGCGHRSWASPMAPGPDPRPSRRSSTAACINAVSCIRPATCWPRSPRPPRPRSRRPSGRSLTGRGATWGGRRAAVRDRARAFGQRYQRLYPAAVACLLDDLPSLTTHLRFPAEHWRRIRHTNLLERTFGESPPPGQGDRPAAERGNLRLLGLGRARPHERRLAWPAPNPAGHPPAARSAPPALRKPGGRSKGGGVRGVSYVLRIPRPPLLHHQRDATVSDEELLYHTAGCH